MATLTRRDFLKRTAAASAGLLASGYLPASSRLLAQEGVTGTIDYWHNFIAEFVFDGLVFVMLFFSLEIGCSRNKSRASASPNKVDKPRPSPR